jgi:hypothetical protein
MKRIKGYLLEKVADIGNLRRASRMAIKNKADKHYVKVFLEHEEENLWKLQKMILTLDFPPVEYHKGEARSSDEKVRDLDKKYFYPWRVLDWAIYLVIKDRLNRKFIYDSYASVEGKGTHFGVKRMKMFLRRYPEYQYYIQTDFKKFFQSIPHSVIIQALHRTFKDERFIQLIIITQLSYESDMEEELDNERRKRETGRYHWLTPKSDTCQLVRRRDLPYLQGSLPSKVSLPQL